jgi:DNA-binding NarL/FixJ family response regulator
LIDGLIITSDNSIFEEFNNNFSSEQNYLEYAASLQAAVEIMDIASPDYIFIIEKNIKDIINIIKHLYNHEKYNKIPMICFIPPSSYEERKELWQYGATDIIQLPILKDEIEIQLEQIFKDIAPPDKEQAEVGMKGKLEDYNPIDLVQIFEQNKKTGVLTLKKYDDEGRIWFYKGEIYDGKYRNFESIDAVLNLMTWIEGDFSITFVDDEYKQKIKLDNEQILLETIQRIDRRNKIFNTLPKRDTILLLSPEVDIEHLEKEEKTFLHFFQAGNTIFDFLYEFDYDELFLLEKIQSFIEKKSLITRNEFDSYMADIVKETNESKGFKSVLKKIFRKKDKEKKKTTAKTKDKPEEEEKVIAELEQDNAPYDYLFNLDIKSLDHIINKIKEL